MVVIDLSKLTKCEIKMPAPDLMSKKEIDKKPRKVTRKCCVCPICNKKFLKSQSLGGHMGHAHPGKS